MSKAKAKSTTTVAPEPPLPSTPDAGLIHACLDYAMIIAAHHAAFQADPDGNSCHAEPLAGRLQRRAGKALAIVSTTPATTTAGANAKSRIVEALLLDNDHLAEDCATFFASFAADVGTHTRAILDAEFAAQRADKVQS